VVFLGRTGNTVKGEAGNPDDDRKEKKSGHEHD